MIRIRQKRGIGSAYDGNIRKVHLTTDTPYNTYTRAGLPPTPIAMPGRDVLRGAGIFVEYEAQTRSEGEIQQLPADHPVTELWRVLAGRAPGRTSAQQVTVFDSVGFALEDFSALQVLHQLALERGVGHDIELVPTDGDPKDLFGRTRNARAPVRLRRVV